MTDFFKMDVFFTVATVATVIIAVLLIAALVYALRFLRTINRIGTEIEEEAGEIRKDIHDARSKVRAFRFAKLFSLFGKGIKRTRRKK